jgi:arylsulfatase A-like enzyme
MVYISHKAVHFPQQPAERHKNLYSDIKPELYNDPNDRLDKKPKWGAKVRLGWDRKILDRERTLSSVDDGVGRIVETLESMKILDDTVIIFAGDNGHLYGEHGLWDKRSAYEGSMRIPLVMRYPPAAKAGTKPDQMVLNIDVAPTLLEFAGIDIPANIQGQSWAGILKGQSGRESFLYEFFREDLDKYLRTTIIGVRTNKWKYLTYPLPIKKTGKFFTSELYDLENDPKELNNLIDDPKYAHVVEKMKKELENLKEKTAFRFPDNKNDK